MKAFDLKEVVAVTCALYRINNNKVVKDNEQKLPTSKDLLTDHFTNNKLTIVTEADREYASLCIAQLQHRIIMNQLTGRNTNDFIDNITQLVVEPADKITQRKFGLAVWIPAVVAGMQAEEQQKLDIAHLSFSSKFQGKCGDKITVNFHPIRVKYVHEYSCFRHFGHDGNGNLIGFLSKKELSGKIKGNVKAHEVSKYNNSGKVTYLNYVKVVE